MLAETLALALALAFSGTPRGGLEATLTPENAARARRGLLPRKAERVRPASRSRRIVSVPQAPTWLGEPGEVVAPAGEAPVAESIAPAATVALEVASAVAGEDPPAGAASWVAMEGAQVEAVLRRGRRREPPAFRAAVEEAEVEVMVRRLAGRGAARGRE